MKPTHCKQCGAVLPTSLTPFYFCGETCCDKWWTNVEAVKRFYSGVEGDFLDGACGQYADALAFVSGYPAVTFTNWTKGDLHCAVQTPHGFLDVAGLLTPARLAEQYHGLSFDDLSVNPSDGAFEDDTLVMAKRQWLRKVTA